MVQLYKCPDHVSVIEGTGVHDIREVAGVVAVPVNDGGQTLPTVVYVTVHPPRVTRLCHQGVIRLQAKV